MKRTLKIIIPLFFLILAGCAGVQKAQKPTWYMNSDAKIQYYQEQINHYQYLIDQEKQKQAKENQ